MGDRLAGPNPSPNPLTQRCAERALMKTNYARTAVAFAVLGVVGMGGLTACSGSKASPAASSASVSASASASASGSPGQRANRAGAFADPKVRQCLTAAGITLPSRAPGERPSGSARPSGTGARPSGVRPSGAGGFFNAGQNTKIQQALKACGITIPNRGPGYNGGTAQPSASPTAS